MTLLFVYGTLMQPDTQQRVFGRVIHGVAAVVEGFDIGLYEGYKMARRGRGRIEGRLLAVTADELARADAYEGPAYARIRVTLPDGQTAWIYAANSAFLGD